MLAARSHMTRGGRTGRKTPTRTRESYLPTVVPAIVTVTCLDCPGQSVPRALSNRRFGSSVSIDTSIGSNPLFRTRANGRTTCSPTEIDSGAPPTATSGGRSDTSYRNRVRLLLASMDAHRTVAAASETARQRAAVDPTCPRLLLAVRRRGAPAANKRHIEAAARWILAGCSRARRGR